MHDDEYVDDEQRCGPGGIPNSPTLVRDGGGTNRSGRRHTGADKRVALFTAENCYAYRDRETEHLTHRTELLGYDNNYEGIGVHAKRKRARSDSHSTDVDMNEENGNKVRDLAL